MAQHDPLSFHERGPVNLILNEMRQEAPEHLSLMVNYQLVLSGIQIFFCHLVAVETIRLGVSNLLGYKRDFDITNPLVLEDIFNKAVGAYFIACESCTRLINFLGLAKNWMVSSRLPFVVGLFCIGSFVVFPPI